MSANTPNLGLFKYDPSTDGAQTFNIQKALNENWDKLDSSILLALAAAAPYSTSQTYALGAYCTRGGKLYKCTTAITSAETWTAAHWTETTMGAELVAISIALQNKADTSSVYNKEESISESTRTALSLPETATPDAALAEIARQLSGTVESTDYPGCYYRMVDGVTEWINPPMVAGEEYRTTERRNGKPVYTKRYPTVGTLPNQSTKWVGTKILKTVGRIFDITGTLFYKYTEGFREFGSIPMERTGSGRISFCQSADDTHWSVGICCSTSDYATDGYTAEFTIKYTKTTD